MLVRTALLEWLLMWWPLCVLVCVIKLDVPHLHIYGLQQILTNATPELLNAIRYVQMYMDDITAIVTMIIFKMSTGKRVKNGRKY